MVNFILKEKTISTVNLGDVEGISISEIPHKTLLSIAPFKGQKEKVSTILKTKFDLELMAPGKISSSDRGMIFSIARDQWMFEALDEKTDIFSTLQIELFDVAATTEQSDSWVEFQLSGENILSFLERICPIDLHEDAFPVGAVARTSMEHISVILIRKKNSCKQNQTYQLMTATSYKNSLLRILTN